jgi:hypothetical protein
MGTCKLLVALAFLTSPDACPTYADEMDVFCSTMWKSNYTPRTEAEVLLVSPFLCLGDIIAAEFAHYQPVNGPARAHALLAPTLREVAIKLEIMDAREANYLLHEPQNFHQDLKQLQQRYQDLAGAPALAECLRFPERDVASELVAANRDFKEHLKQRLLIDPVHADEIEAAIAETDRLHQVWNTVREARCGFYYVVVRRQALKQLRELLGDQAFYRGELPPHLPIWRLPRQQ